MTDREKFINLLKDFGFSAAQGAPYPIPENNFRLDYGLDGSVAIGSGYAVAEFFFTGTGSFAGHEIRTK
jgi:hypothetical protein